MAATPSVDVNLPDDDDLPPGFSPPTTNPAQPLSSIPKNAAAAPVFVPRTAGTSATTTTPSQSAAADVEKVTKAFTSATELGSVDEPDPSLSLREEKEEEAEITTQSGTQGGIYASASKFEDLPLSPELLKGLYVEMKFERPSKIQAKTLPMILTPPYNDLIAQAQNGSGKTTCFVLAMLSRVDPNRRVPQAICTCPTRELAIQNLSVVQRMGKFTGITATSTATETEGPGRMRTDPITEQVVVGTHGKLKAWVKKRLMSLDDIEILVLDEADEMLKADGFADDSVRLIKAIKKANPVAQLLLFSATFNEDVKKFALTIAPHANHVFVAKEELSLDVIKQFVVPCPDRAAKTRVLKEFIFPNCEKLGQTIIFVRTREMARTLHSELEKEGHKCTSIEGSMEHSERDKVVEEFRKGITKILISTDVLARGFDVSQVTLVINYDVPIERMVFKPAFETYLHRVGRSGRFGRKGAAFNLVCGAQDTEIMDTIQTYFKKPMESIKWDDEDKFLEVLAKSF